MAMVVAIALFCHAALFRYLAGKLIVDEAPGEYQWIGIVQSYDGKGGGNCYELAREMQSDRSTAKFLLIGTSHDRLVEAGILPSYETAGRGELEAKGVSPDTIATTERDGSDDWATARAIRDWLESRPKDAVVLLGSSFGSAHLRYALDTVLGPELSSRVRLRAIPSRQYNEMAWWTSRAGIRNFGIDWLRLLRGWCCGEEPPFQSGTADEYESAVQKHATFHKKNAQLWMGTRLRSQIATSNAASGRWRHCYAPHVSCPSNGMSIFQA